MKRGGAEGHCKWIPGLVVTPLPGDEVGEGALESSCEECRLCYFPKPRSYPRKCPGPQGRRLFLGKVLVPCCVRPPPNLVASNISHFTLSHSSDGVRQGTRVCVPYVCDLSWDVLNSPPISGGDICGLAGHFPVPLRAACLCDGPGFLHEGSQLQEQVF